MSKPCLKGASSGCPARLLTRNKSDANGLLSEGKRTVDSLHFGVNHPSRNPETCSKGAWNSLHLLHFQFRSEETVNFRRQPSGYERH
jgi:hypothetical protein